MVDGAQGDEETSDPFKRANRAVFAFNDALDRTLLALAARAYRLVTSPWVRAGLRNVLDNLRSPVVLANDLLQAEPRRATETTGRFMLNTILGVGGLIDVVACLVCPHATTRTSARRSRSMAPVRDHI